MLVNRMKLPSSVATLPLEERMKMDIIQVNGIIRGFEINIVAVASA